MISKDTLANEKLILEGNLHHLILRLSPPSIIGIVLLGLNNFIDAAYVGNLVNSEAVAGITFVYPIYQMVLGFASLIGMGGANIGSILIGKKDSDKLGRLLNNVILIGVILSFLTSIVFYLFPENLIRLMGVQGQAYQYGVEYLENLSYGIFFTILGMGLNVFIRSEGKMVTPMLLLGIGIFVNIILTPIFIAILDLGVIGAAHATNVAMLVAFIANYSFFLVKEKRALYKPFTIKLDKYLLGETLKLGLPNLILYLFTLIQHYIVLKFLLYYGSNSEVAFFGAANRILMFFVLPVYGMSRALQPIVGINFGAKSYKRCHTTYNIFNIWGLILNIFVVAFLIIFAENVLKFILPDLNEGSFNINNFIVYIATLLFLPLLIFSMVYFQAIGNSKIPGLLITFRQIIIFAPLAYLLSVYFQVSGIYYSFFLVDLVLLICCILLVRKENKKHLV